MNVEIVVPVYNEQGNVEELYRQVVRELEPLGVSFGFLFVDDGSRDRTIPILEELSARDPRVRFISFTRNFGHQAALLAGLEHSTGQAVITMDGDLQHPPHVLPALIREWRNGAEIVVTTRDFGVSMGPFKRLATKAFYSLMNRISGVHIPPGAADFRLLDRRALETIVSFPERQKFLRGLASWTGHRTALIEYMVGQRHAGEVKYSLAKLAQLGWNGVTSFSATPLRLAFYLGLIIFAVSGIYGLAAVIAHFAGHTPAGWTSVLVCILAIGGLQMIFIGLIGEYLARVFDEVKGRPTYILRSRTENPERPLPIPAKSLAPSPIADRSGN